MESWISGKISEAELNCIKNGNTNTKESNVAFTKNGEKIECQVACERQENQIKTSEQNFPNEIFSENANFLLVIRKLFWSCLDAKTEYGFKRPGMIKKYPKICPFFDKYFYNNITSKNILEIENTLEELVGVSVETFYENLEAKMNKTDMEMFKSSILEYSKEHLVLMSVSMGKPYMSVFQTDVVMSLPTFVGNVGGSLGLCMGFSLVSIAEIIYYLIIKPGLKVLNIK